MFASYYLTCCLNWVSNEHDVAETIAYRRVEGDEKNEIPVMDCTFVE